MTMGLLLEDLGRLPLSEGPYKTHSHPPLVPCKTSDHSESRYQE